MRIASVTLLFVGALLPAGAAAQETFPSAPPRPTQSVKAAGFDIEIFGDFEGFKLTSETQQLADGLEVLMLRFDSPMPGREATPPRFSLRWSLPSHDVAGHWMTGRHQTKTIRPDWAGSRLQTSILAREAPVSCLFTSDNRNVLTFAVNDGLNMTTMGSGVREEDGMIYNEVSFTERRAAMTSYGVAVRIDRRPVPYETALHDVAEWWAAMPEYSFVPTPEAARRPVYSTWYNYHQNVDASLLLKELAIAKQLGYESIIIDDGWQTLDNRRGYAFTGDWEPERIPDMKGFVDACHKLGVKVVLWYAVPFMGKNAKAMARFKDRTLRFDERLSTYVLDPRYPEVRQYLVDTYVKAIRDWGIDGFKFDFIERFVADDQTVLEATGGRDHASVNRAADSLMAEVALELFRLKPDVMIEVRQPYVGPRIYTWANMFRASDSPNAYLANKVKTIDLRLLSRSGTAVHADMIMWHNREPVELAAFQFLNILFSVPQLSVRLGEIPKDHFSMVKFYTEYWLANREVLLDARIEAPNPLANYPLVRARAGDKQIIALYADMVARIVHTTRRIDIVNAKHSRAVVIAGAQAPGMYSYEIRDCRGNIVKKGELLFGPTPVEIEAPVSGLVSLERLR